MALDAGRARVENGNSPQSPALPRADRDAMEEFLESLRVLLGALGFPLLQPIAPGKRPRLEDSDTTANPLLNRTLRFQVARSWINATGAVTDEGFVVFQGSLGSPIVKPYLRARRKITRAFGRRCIAASGVARRSNTPVCSTPRALLASRIGALGAPVYFAAALSEGYKLQRNELVAEGVITRNGPLIMFTRDTLFTSPSAAAAILAGGAYNGREAWRDEHGTQLKVLEDTLAGGAEDGSTNDVAPVVP